MEEQKVYRTDNEEDVTELRRQILGNLTLAVETWPIEHLLNLEDKANRLATAGIVSEALMFQGLVDTANLIFDEKGKMKLSFNPDDENCIFKVLAKQIEENDKRFAEMSKDLKKETKPGTRAVSKSWTKPEDDYSKFF